MSVRWVLVLVMLAGLTAPSERVIAHDLQQTRPAVPPAARTDLVSHGLRLTLLVPFVQPFPRSALFEVQVSATNVSGHDVLLPRACDRDNPRAVTANGAGVVVYSTVKPGLVTEPCHAEAPLRLSPDRSVKRSTYVILRGPAVQPVADVLEGGHTVRLAGKVFRLPIYHYTTGTRPRSPPSSSRTADGSQYHRGTSILAPQLDEPLPRSRYGRDFR